MKPSRFPQILRQKARDASDLRPRMKPVAATESDGDAIKDAVKKE